jgi:hypothetical protein
LPDAATTRPSFFLSRWLRALRPREVLVFVSSPGDCTAERNTARCVVTELNNRPEVARQGIRFRPLLWEDLPPSIAEDGDFQRRIDRSMRRFGYDAYGIYLGIMKGRLGTPTPRYRSGTIEELETSLTGRQRSGMPSEVLMYFLAPDADEKRQVRDFRGELERRGFLSATVAAGHFQDRLGQNLFEIASSWNSWANVLRRTWRRFGIGIVAAVGLVAVLIIGVDVGSRWRIGRALDRGDLAGAAELWRDWSLVMPVSGPAARRRINDAAAESIGAEAPLERQLALLADWQSRRVFLPVEFAALTEQLGRQAERAIEAGVLESPDLRGIHLWRVARNASIWSDDPEVATHLLGLLAGGRLLRALTATGVPPEEWEGALLRPAEAAALKSLAQQILKRTPHLAGWKERRLRVAVAVMAGDQGTLARLAADAVRAVDTSEQPELAAFLATAPAEAVSAWLRQIAAPTLSLHVIGNIVDAAHARGDPAVIVALADLAGSGQLPEGADALLEDVVCPLPACVAPATDRLVAWANGAPLAATALNLLLPALKPDVLGTTERERLTRAILAREQADERSPEMIRALSELGAPNGVQFLDDLVDEHARGAISFGFAEREALIDDLRRRGEHSDRLADARALVLRTEEDAGILADGRNVPFGTLGLDSVERAYLDLLAETALVATPDDRGLLGRIIGRMAQGEDPVSGSRKVEALGRALRAVPADWRDSLFAFPAPPVLDPPWEPVWDRRRLFLQALGSAGGQPPPDLAAAVFRSLPNDEELAADIARLAAAIDRSAGRDFFRSRLASGDRGALLELGHLGDAKALAAYIENHAQDLGAAREASDLEQLVGAIGALNETRRKPVITALISQVPSAATRLLPLATSVDVDRPELRTAALDAIRRPTSAGALAAAVGYLARVAPAELWPALTSEPAIGRLTEWLANAERFDWVMVAQEMVEPPHGRLPSDIASLAEARRLLVVYEGGAHLSENALSGWMALDNQRPTASHFLALLARHAEPAVALESLQALAEAPPPAEVLGELRDVETVFRAYATWLAAVPLAARPLDCLPSAWFGVERLDDANPLVVRAAGALVLASPRTASGGPCPQLAVRGD